MSLIKFIFYITALLIAQPSYAAALPKGILAQLPKGYEVMTFLSGELNDDKLTDYLVVVNKQNEKVVFDKTGEGSSRPLYIFTQNPNKSFLLARVNHDVVFGINDGGQCDPFMDGEDGLAIKNHFFTVQNGVAFGSHWNDFITFKYDSKLKDWVFHKRVFESWHLNTNEDPNADALVEDKPKVTKADIKHPIFFEKYKP